METTSPNSRELKRRTKSRTPLVIYLSIIVVSVLIVFFLLKIFSKKRTTKSGNSNQPTGSVPSPVSSVSPIVSPPSSMPGSPTESVSPIVSPSSPISTDCTEVALATCDRVTSLMSELEGYGRSTMGGIGGIVYHVTTLAESGPGSLREGATLEGPVWIVFDVDGTISLDNSPIRFTARKTVDGRGRRILITGRGFGVVETEHVIITNIEFKRTIDDAITCKYATHCWYHRLKVGDNKVLGKDVADGLIDITRQSDNVTVSWSYFYTHHKGLLFSDNKKVTLHHNYFYDIGSRIPQVKRPGAIVHSYNNYRENCPGSDNRAFDVREGASALIEHDLFVNSGKVATIDSPEKSSWKIVNCHREGGKALPGNYNENDVFTPDYPYELEDARTLKYLKDETGPK